MTVKQMRVLAEFTQVDCANRLGITPLSYRKKEKGETEFKWKEILILAKMFHQPLDNFKDFF